MKFLEPYWCVSEQLYDTKALSLVTVELPTQALE